jgi:hypothetical protein
VKHHFIHLSRHSSVHPSNYPFVTSWSVYFDGSKKEWNTNVARRRIIYISVVNFYFYFLILILGFLDLGTLILSLSQQLKELGWAFFFFFFFEILFRILKIFNAFYIAIIFYYSSMDARASSH